MPLVEHQQVMDLQVEVVELELLALMDLLILELQEQVVQGQT
tara:strand:- start:255 stop:380 length:126 start_codon:yes stop_codon:yes gene_type:complete